MNQLIEKIKTKDWQVILNYAKTLSDTERYETIEVLKKIDIDEDIIKADGRNLRGQARSDFYENRAKLSNCLHFFLSACARNYEDLKKLEIPHEYFVFNPLYSLLSTSDYQPLIAFYTIFPPDYLNKVLKDISKEKFRNVNFKTLWKFYEKGWVDFEEAFFVRSLLVVQMFNRNTQEDADFLLEHKEAINKVFINFYKHETPVLDISKWDARSGFVCKKVCEYWTEVILILTEKGFVFDRTIVSNLLQSLLNNWKKPHLDWHVRLLDIFKPTPNELIENQATLFSILGTRQPSLVNYAVQKIKEISSLQGFDKEGFINNIPLIFLNEKCAKSILVGLDILDKLFSKSLNISLDYREQLAVLLMQADTKIQEKTAIILSKHFDNGTLKNIIEPYFSYLKQKTKEILIVSEDVQIDEISFNSDDKKVFVPLVVPATWDELLFHIGNCIRTKSVTDIDLFYEGLNQLQLNLPLDYEKQLKPYTKQLFNRRWDSNTMAVFSLFIEYWIKKMKLNFAEDPYNPILFFKKKSTWFLVKLENKDNLPFLSTPTHAPFYVHPNILLEKLLQYEKKEKEVCLEDLIVACNRMLLNEIDNTSIEQSKKLKGVYAKAIQYYMGATNKIEYTEETLPLWTQITRIKYPNGIFVEFENSKASDYPSVIKPFDIDIDIDIDANQYITWYRLVLHNNWNYAWYRKETITRYDPIFYNTASTDKGTRIDINFQLSLNPFYLDAQLCRYIPTISGTNEVIESEECLYPLQFLVENDLPIYHSGWIYIAACLLYEKKISRDLASEYIQLAVCKNEKLDYLARVIGQLIALKYAPINRLIEYFDKPNNNKEIKVFQLKVLENCILHFDINSMPINNKKIISYYGEWINVLKTETKEIVLDKLNKLKK